MPLGAFSHFSLVFQHFVLINTKIEGNYENYVPHAIGINYNIPKVKMVNFRKRTSFCCLGRKIYQGEVENFCQSGMNETNSCY